MLILGITEEASLELLARATLGRVACTHEGQPYITPMSVTYEGSWLYGFSSLGQKIAWMRANPRVCSVDDLVKAMGMSGISNSQVSRLCEWAFAKQSA